MSENKEKKHSKEEVQYQKRTYNYQQKCDKCSNKNRAKDNCDILSENDNEVNPNGWCIKFNPGKHLIIDNDEATPEEQAEIQRKKVVWLKQQEHLRKKKFSK